MPLRFVAARLPTPTGVRPAAHRTPGRNAEAFRYKMQFANRNAVASRSPGLPRGTRGYPGNPRHPVRNSAFTRRGGREEGYCGVTSRRTKILTSPVGRVYSTDVPLSTTPTDAGVHAARSGEVCTA